MHITCAHACVHTYITCTHTCTHVEGRFGHSCSQPQPGTLSRLHRGVAVTAQPLKDRITRHVPGARGTAWSVPATHTCHWCTSSPRLALDALLPVPLQGKLGRIGPPGCKGDPGSRVSTASAPPMSKPWLWRHLAPGGAGEARAPARLSLTPAMLQPGLEPQQDKMALEAFGSG